METAPDRFASAPPPRVLLVEDDPVSQQFMQAVLEQLGAEVDLAPSAQAARMLAREQAHALWMIDVNLPDSRGPALLAELRGSGAGVPALAHTADADPELARQLTEDGFDAVLVKPFTRQGLMEAVRAHLPLSLAAAPAGRVAEAAPRWDDAQALGALNGQATHLKALRELFLAELPALRQQVVQAGQPGHPPEELPPQLHRLQASCGFVGATRLARAARALHRQPADPLLRAQLVAAIDDLLAG